jgi:glucose-6-phosphate 1-dehydrogenase
VTRAITLCVMQGNDQIRAAPWAPASAALASCRKDCGSHMDSFLKELTYVSGQYNEESSYKNLHQQLRVKVSICGPHV